jgi:hypothetical protein
MRKRGRKSAAELATPPLIEAVARPDAPYDLTDEQTIEWWAIVNRLPADWFPRETHGMLSQYCRHVIAARRVAEMIVSLNGGMAEHIANGADKLETLLSASKCLDRLLKMQEREGRALSSLATRMRITQQSTMHPETRKPPVTSGPPPWLWRPEAGGVS